MLDDLMVLRVCAQLTQGCDRGLPAAEISLDRGEEADKITGFVGGVLHDKLRAYCAKLVISVRGARRTSPTTRRAQGALRRSRRRIGGVRSS